MSQPNLKVLPKDERRPRVSHNGLQAIITRDTSELWAEREEEALLGAVLREPTAFPSLADLLQAGDFYLLFNGFVWHAYETLFAAGKDIDILSVAAELEKQPAIGVKGDELLLRLSQLVGAAPFTAHAESYALMVREAALRLRLLRLGNELMGMAFDKQLSGEELIDTATRQLYSATDQRAVRPTELKHIVSAYYDRMEEAVQAGLIHGTPTGFRDLDALLHVLIPGEVSILAGNDGMGKTTVLLSIVLNVILRGQGVALFSIEMTQFEIVAALVAMLTGIPKGDLKARRLSPAQLVQFTDAAGRLANMPLHIIDDHDSLTPLQLRRRLRSLMVKHELSLVVVDGLWLMSDDGADPNRPKEVATIMKKLTAMARDKDIFLPFLVAHQYTDAPWKRKKERRPIKTDLAESSGVRRTAQVILGLHNEAYYKHRATIGAVECHVLKDRTDGKAQGKYVKLAFDEKFSRYVDYGGTVHDYE